MLASAVIFSEKNYGLKPCDRKLVPSQFLNRISVSKPKLAKVVTAACLRKKLSEARIKDLQEQLNKIAEQVAQLPDDKVEPVKPSVSDLLTETDRQVFQHKLYVLKWFLEIIEESMHLSEQIKALPDDPSLAENMLDKAPKLITWRGLVRNIPLETRRQLQQILNAMRCSATDQAFGFLELLAGQSEKFLDQLSKPSFIQIFNCDAVVNLDKTLSGLRTQVMLIVLIALALPQPTLP